MRMLEHSFSRLFVPWNIRSRDGTFVPGPFVPENFGSRKGINPANLTVRGFVPWNFGSRYPGPFQPWIVRSFVSRAVAGPLTKKERRNIL